MSRRPCSMRSRSRSAFLSISLVLVLTSLCLGASPAHAEDSPKQEEASVVEAGSTVGIEYTLTLEDGTQVESNVGGEVLRFEQGSGQIIPGLDRELIGMKVSEAKQVMVSPEEGYGLVDPGAFREIPLSELPEDAREPGTPLTASDSEGRTQLLRVHKVEGDMATLDFNHPLAGKTLVFAIKILDIQ